MNRILRRRPSPALVISLIALFVSLGGGAYALTVTGGQVKNGSLTGKDIRKDSLAGPQIRESKVGKVPRARVADRVGRRTSEQVTTQAFFAAQKSPKGFTDVPTEIGRLSLPPGSYIISAKVTASNTASTTLQAKCILRAGTSEDQATATLPSGQIGANTQAIPLLQAHFQNTPFDVSVLCQAVGNPGLNLGRQPPFTSAQTTKIAAIRADDARIIDF